MRSPEVVSSFSSFPFRHHQIPGLKSYCHARRTVSSHPYALVRGLKYIRVPHGLAYPSLKSSFLLQEFPLWFSLLKNRNCASCRSYHFCRCSLRLFPL